MSKKENINAAALRLWEAAKTRIPCKPVRELIGANDLLAAYEVQRINSKKRLQGGTRLVGKKIGLTSLAVQQQLGVDQPDFGVLFEDMQVLPGQEIDWQDLMQPKIEAEVAFVLGNDIDGHDINLDQVVNAIDHVVASLEIVGSRIEHWDIKIADTIADNASASHFVIGNKKVKLADIRLPECVMKMEKNGVEISHGSGAACLGSPVQSVLWLARTMVRLGNPLQAGDVILSGALGPMGTVAPGDYITAGITGLGMVSVNFGE